MHQKDNFMPGCVNIFLENARFVIYNANRDAARQPIGYLICRMTKNV